MAVMLRRLGRDQVWFGKKMRHRERIALPRRLFKSLIPRSDGSEYSEDDAPLPLLRRVFSVFLSYRLYFRPDVNENDGYALIRALHASHIPLIRFLLANGADPTCKSSLAVRIAIRKRDLNLLMMLIERDADDEPPDDGSCSRIADGRKRKTSAKRRRVSDRVDVTTAMLREAVEVDARDIVEYLIDKGARPDMQTLQRMQRF